MSYSNKLDCRLVHPCGGCKKKQIFVNTGRFRVNANGRRLDIWLIYRCQKCRHTLNIPIYERVSPDKLSRELYGRFLDNDEALAREYGGDRSFFKSRGYTLTK